MTRAQTESYLFFANVKTAETKLILTENDAYWVNVTDDLFFLPDGKHFLWASERDGFMHLYRFNIDGTLVNKITAGDWAVASSGGAAFWVRQAISRLHQQHDLPYFPSLKDSSLQRNLYCLNLHR